MHCAIVFMDDGNPIRVISETEFMKTMGIYRSGALSVRRDPSEAGAQIPLSLAFKNLKPYIIKHLGDVHYQPLKVRYKSGSIGHGITAELIPKICEIWLDARKDGVLGKTQTQIAEFADILLRGLAKVGIIALVDEATGYQDIRDRVALQKILDAYLTDEWAKWTRRFPNDFYRNLFRLKKSVYPPTGKNLPQYVGHWTNDIVYSRLAPGVLKKLRELNPRTQAGGRARKHHQHLTLDVGVPELEQHLSNVSFLMKTCQDWNEFRRRLDIAAPKFGDTRSMNLEV